MSEADFFVAGCLRSSTRKIADVGLPGMLTYWPVLEMYYDTSPSSADSLKGVRAKPAK